jgi:hypothetical protein
VSNWIWITPRHALQMLGQKKLCQLTNEIGQQEPIGMGDANELVFKTPFAFGNDLKVYVGGNLVGGYSFSVDENDGERVVVTFALPPDALPVTASSTDSVNADNLDAAMLRAQALVRGALDAQYYSVPTDDSAIPEPLLSWMAAIAWYLLATDPRRPRLLEAYPEIEKRYIDVYGGIDSDLKRVAKGTFSLRGILTTLDSTLVTAGSEFISNVPVFTYDKYRGVL